MVIIDCRIWELAFVGTVFGNEHKLTIWKIWPIFSGNSTSRRRCNLIRGFEADPFLPSTTDPSSPRWTIVRWALVWSKTSCATWDWMAAQVETLNNSLFYVNMDVWEAVFDLASVLQIKVYMYSSTGGQWPSGLAFLLAVHSIRDNTFATNSIVIDFILSNIIVFL